MTDKKKKWLETHYVTVFELARNGKTNKDIAQVLGVSEGTFERWRRLKPALEDSVNRGRMQDARTKQGPKVPQFHEYIFNQLPPDLQELWTAIKQVDRRDATAQAQIDALLERRGKYARQNIFLYALTSSNFKVSRALSRAGIGKTTLDKWCEDPTFKALIDEISWHKDNFFEDCFIRLVQAGDSAAVRHVAESRLADRGYSKTQNISLDGQIDAPRTVDVDKLDLPVGQRVALLAALRVAQADDVIEGEVTSG